MNRHTGEEAADRIKPLLIDLFASGWKGEFRELRQVVKEKLGHEVHPTFIFRPLMELQKEKVAHCLYSGNVHTNDMTENQKKFTHNGKMLWQAVTTVCLWCGSTEAGMTPSGEVLCVRCEGD